MSRRAFSLIELLMVIAVIAVLASMMYAGLSRATGDAKDTMTNSAVSAIAAAIAAYRPQVIAAPGGTMYRMFDFNGDANNFLDGDPQTDPDFDATWRSRATAAGYRGTMSHLGLELPSRLVKDGYVIDGWGNRLRIRWSQQTFGSVGFGIWSLGPDGVSGNEDDIRSWPKQTND